MNKVLFKKKIIIIIIIILLLIGSLQDLVLFAFTRLLLSKYQLTIQQGGAQLWAECTDTQADHALNVAIAPA